MPLGDYSDAIAKLNEASRSRLLVIVDGNTTALECMAMGKHETHFLSSRPFLLFQCHDLGFPSMRQHC